MQFMRLLGVNQPVVALPQQAPDTVVYTDGGCKTRDYHVGSFAWKSMSMTTGVRQGAGAYLETTVNRMEIHAIRHALRALPRGPSTLVRSDSAYCVNGLTKWLKLWSANGWIGYDGQPIKNRDLWETMIPLVAEHNVRFEHVKGHAGDPDNEWVDQRCTVEMREALRRYAQGVAVPIDAGCLP